ncbi:sugar kinase [Saccharophagus degradans]|uniref:2-keto-3-deoxygluconate kinase n=1 Tax=Saccharophagus degradans (strain 2-40 / ATCC 43961 / DSM 17024) TaxID=203122 RepID=Q21M78_SACD2|nr:sugar kinase [Saccharophagus degradans]ABD80201.1 2-keto-3-deoxygluconate kinase [Saccharophagus degradans 2-40]
MPQIAAIGEVMIELAPAGTDATSGKAMNTLSFAGDTYNTVVTLARLGIDASYVSRLGDDRFSDNIIANLSDENVATNTIERAKGEVPGLYMIQNTPDGEREFFYWRGQAPAKQMFTSANTPALLDSLSAHPWLYFSGITLAIISEQARITLFGFLASYRANGGKVAFDSNYRPRLWANPELAQQATIAALAQTDLALLTLDDEALLWGDSDDLLADAQKRYQSLEISELVFKRGADDVIIVQGDSEQRVSVPKVENIIDTTAAGDTFNAGYLSARLKGEPPVKAAQEANRCANIVIRHRGGVIPKEVFLEEHRALLKQ